FRALEHDHRAAHLDLVADVQLALVDPSAIDHRAGLVAQIDERDVFGASDLDHGMHARCELVVHPEMALGILADLDDVLRHGLPSLQRITLVERECENRLCHASSMSLLRSPCRAATWGAI